MELNNWFGAISAFDCDFFASPVLFNLLEWSAGGIWVFLVEVLLKLWELVEVPVLLSKPLTGVAELSRRRSAPVASSTTSKARGSSTIPSVSAAISV